MFFDPCALEASKPIDTSSVDLAPEIACGTGRVSFFENRIIHEYFGIDFENL
jgi:hypothetical protein